VPQNTLQVIPSVVYLVKCFVDFKASHLLFRRARDNGDIFQEKKNTSYEEGTVVYDGEVGLNLEVLQRNAT